MITPCCKTRAGERLAESDEELELDLHDKKCICMSATMSVWIRSAVQVDMKYL